MTEARVLSRWMSPRATFLSIICRIVIGSTVLLGLAAGGENCRSGADLDDATRSRLTSAAMRDFDLIAKGDAFSLKQNAIPSLAADFSGIDAVVKDNHAVLQGSTATPRPPFLLQAEGTSALAHAEFYCGVFGASGQTRDSAVFYLNNLAPGKYGVVILDATTSQGPYAVSLILQQAGADWKIGGLYIKAEQFGGHDSAWFVARAKEFQSKGQMHNDWLYYTEARVLISPLPFMSTLATDKLYDDSQKVEPSDFPADGKTLTLSWAGALYKLTAIYPDAVGNDLDLIVKYEVPDVSNTNQVYESNIAVMKALITKYPELREGFASVVARAVDPSGRDYGTLLAMKDIK